MDEIEFKSTYARNKPLENDEVIFSCLRGARAQVGAEIAAELGFKKYINLFCFCTKCAQFLLKIIYLNIS